MTGDRVQNLSLRLFPAAAAVAALALLLLIPSARGDTESVVWNLPTPPNNSRFTVDVGTPVSLTLTASTTTPDTVVHIEAAVAPAAIAFNSSDGTAARATFAWTPEKAGTYKLEFTATAVTTNGTGEAAPKRTYTIVAKAPTQPNPHETEKYPHAYNLFSAKVAHWAAVERRSAVRAKPKMSAPIFMRLASTTSDGTQNIVLILNAIDTSPTVTWYRVRLPILPNNSTGWVRSTDLGDVFTVHTHLYVDRNTFTATLMRDGKPIFTTRVGVGKPYWPTPAGQFYIRDKLTGFGDPFYGPVAFGTSARSAVLTDWPGGGFVGVHGTNQPQILPGRVSHGCIRMQNASILKLARLMPVGTPLTVR